MFISLSARLLLNSEALNSVETVGNLSRHRSVPIIIPLKEGYTVKYVPAISGESIGHGYQAELVEVAKSLNLPIGLYSSRNEFIKFSEDDYLKDEGIKPPKDYNDMRRFEVDVLLKDIVADVGGFLYTGDFSVKRTSRFQVGYMVPSLGEVIDATAVEAQFHVRYLVSKPQKGGASQAGARLGQAIYNVEIASALYTLTINLDIENIGKPSITFGNKSEQEDRLSQESPRRKKAAILALSRLLSNMTFGGKHSRFLPNSELRSCVLSLTKHSFTVTPGNYCDYAQRSWDRLRKYSKLLKDNGQLWYVDREGISCPDGATKCNSIEEIFESVIGEIEKIMKLD